MARGKKKESALTPEEKLAQALVPDWECPYRVPENWRWTILKACCKDVFSGKSPKYSKEPTDIRIIGQQANRRDGIDLSYVKYGTVDFAESQEDRMWLRKNDVLLNTLGSGTIGRSGIYKDNERLLTDGHLFVFRSNECYLPDLMYYYLCANEEQIIKSANGSTNQKFLSLSTFSLFPLPVPPIAEQQRIVDRIEYLFAKLDEAKEKAQSVLDSFETRKAAILHKAFTGELTAKWRAEHGVSLDNWERLKLGEIGILERGRSQHRPRNDPRLFDGPYPFIQTGDVASANVYVTEHRQTLSKFGMAQSRMFPAGTLCITIAANIGDVAILSYDCCFPDSVVGFTPNQRSISKFVYYMMSVLQKELEDNAPATAQKNINLKILNAVEISIPTVEEQEEIVRILDSLFAKEQKAKEAAETVLEKIDLLKKSVLARAFRGELGTNDPTEESALEVLKKVLDIPTEPKAPIKRTFIPKDLENQIKTELERKIIKLYIQGDTDVIPISQMMSVSSKKFEIMDTLRSLQQRGILAKENDAYKLLR